MSILIALCLGLACTFQQIGPDRYLMSQSNSAFWAFNVHTRTFEIASGTTIEITQCERHGATMQTPKYVLCPSGKYTIYREAYRKQP